ncbi:hypothetical protein BDW59DRAFT_158413 [Aspergillus cavernicola]|uniref:Uncharacterized protein n=1 Tax=Aspergillus cavernicola TaxID=176166 RepID=A0ABR4IRW2_9EURO
MRSITGGSQCYYSRHRWDISGDDLVEITRECTIQVSKLVNLSIDYPPIQLVANGINLVSCGPEFLLDVTQLPRGLPFAVFILREQASNSFHSIVDAAIHQLTVAYRTVHELVSIKILQRKEDLTKKRQATEKELHLIPSLVLEEVAGSRAGD